MKPQFDPKTVKYHLPDEKIALYPLAERDHSKLLIIPKEGQEFIHTHFYDLPNHIPVNSLMFVNVSKVIHARIPCMKESGGLAEVLLTEPTIGAATDAMMNTEKSEWKCIIGGKKILPGMILSTMEKQHNLKIHVLEKSGMDAIIELQWSGPKNLAYILEEIGKIPLPPYLNREAEASDEERYQTVYAKDDGSVAAPTAGLHFTEHVIERLKQQQVSIDEVTLHVGLGTFKPFDANAVEDFSMHSEKIIIRKEVIEHCRDFFLNDQRGTCIAVGTTSCRTMESLYWFGVGLINPEHPAWHTGRFSLGQWDVYDLCEYIITPQESCSALLRWMERHRMNSIQGETQLMIVPGYKWGMIEGLVTNFHQPESTLLFLVSSFLGIERWEQAYQSALDNKYRFLSYGDSSLLLH